MDAKTRDLLKATVDASTYREFLSEVFSILGQQSRSGRFNHSTFARRAGFKSRGFAQEVVSGRKRLTSKSYPKFEKALALPPRAAALFHALVVLEEPSMNDDESSEKELRARLESARARLRSELGSRGSDKQISQNVFRHRHVLTVYATLGNQKTGVTFEDIVRRTTLQPALVRRVLAHLTSSNVAIEKGGRFKSMNPHLVFQGLGGDHPAKDAYLDTLGELQVMARDHFSDGDKTFIHSHVSLNPKRLAALKKRLWEVVLQFIDECDDDGGEVVAKFLVGFYV